MEKEEAIDSAGVKRMLNITKDIGLAEGPEFYVRYFLKPLGRGIQLRVFYGVQSFGF
jgi:hypothetical protein